MILRWFILIDPKQLWLSAKATLLGGIATTTPTYTAGGHPSVPRDT